MEFTLCCWCCQVLCHLKREPCGGDTAGAFGGVAEPGSQEELGMHVAATASSAVGRKLEAKEKIVNCDCQHHKG